MDEQVKAGCIAEQDAIRPEPTPPGKPPAASTPGHADGAARDGRRPGSGSPASTLEPDLAGPDDPASGHSHSDRREQTPADPHRRRWRKRLAIAGTATVLVVAPPTAWALNRFVIDHVQIADVSAYELAQAPGGSDGSSADASTTDADAATDTDTDTVSGTDTDTTPETDTTPATGTASTPGDSTDTSSTADGTSSPVITADSYTDADTHLTISKVVTGSGDDQITYFVADVVLNDATQLRSAFAQNAFGTNIVEYTSDIAADNDAVFAINGDYYGFRDSGIVIRNGVVYRDTGAREGLAIFRDGTMRVYDETQTSAEQLLANGVWNTLSFGPALLDDGQIVSGIDDVEVDTNFGNHSIQGSQPRTGIGIIAPNHYVFVVVDGRSPGYSRGVTMTEFAQIFADLGASTAYNLDGGGSSAMYFNGQVVNDPLGRGQERGTSDILYVG